MEAKSSKTSFSSNYLLINSKRASLFDTGRLLFSSNLENRDFIESSFKREQSFHYRLVIVISVLLQKFLLKIDRPVEFIGRRIEYALNILHFNGGFFGLITNIMLGKVGFPDWRDSTYLSFNGLMDRRMELDSNIKYGNPMYYPALSIMASKAAYNNPAYNRALIEDQWKMEFLGFFDYWNDFLGKADTQVVMFRDKGVDHDTIVVSFRGTQPFCGADWCSDADLSWYEFPDVGKIHSGFLKALGMQKTYGWPKSVVRDDTREKPLAYYDIRDKLRYLLEKIPDAKFIVTGHSLGGALAALFPAVLFCHDERFLLERMEGVYTFGQPRVGDAAFGKYMEKNLKKNGIQYYRYVYSYDMVPRVPFDGMFKHFGTCVYYNSKYEASIVDEEPYKNYFSIWGFVSMRKNAIYELLRCFIMRSKYGADYRECWLLFWMRMFGLMIPGISAHCVQDYVNATRLGSPHLDLFHSFHYRKHEMSLLPAAIIDGIWHLFCILMIPINLAKLALLSLLKSLM